MKLKALDEKKIQVLDKLAASTINTEKKVTALQTDEIIVISKEQSISQDDMLIIPDFQKAIKKKKVFSFITGASDKKGDESNGYSRNDRGTGSGFGAEPDESIEEGVQCGDNGSKSSQELC